MTALDLILPTAPEALHLHNGARRVADGPSFRAAPEFLSDPNQWGYSVSFPLRMPALPDPDLRAFVVVDVVVLEGMIGVGVLDNDFRDFISPEVDAQATGRPASIELRLDTIAPAAHVMVRNTAPHGVPSRFRVLGAALQFRAKDDRLLIPARCPPIAPTVHATPSLSATFDLLISHTSRRWNPAQGDRDYLVERYARPGRLNDLPPFDSLPPNNAPYHGRLTLCRIELSPAAVTSCILQHYDSPEKIQHGCVVGDEFVVCFDSSLAVFARRDTRGIEPIPERMERVADPWLGGLHTVVPAGDGRTCLVSSSGADAILWLDVPRRTVVRRWRLPASRYGVNYALDDTTWLSEHYIPNDLQLGHLNCAAPDGAGGVFFSVLGQGDVGRVAQDGAFDLLVSGYVGCHGVRYDPRAGLLYFCDSCRGRLMRVDGHDRATVLFDAGSRWLHDAVHLGQGAFLLTLGDTNRLALVDTTANRLLAEWDFGAVDGTLQFLSTP
jgi:hypothetical protein